MKLQVFKNTYFEEHLWATACERIRMFNSQSSLTSYSKILNGNVNKKKKKHVREFDVRSPVTQEF